MDCIFCKIVSGEAPSFKVHEDDLTVTFMDLFPVKRGHALIAPRDHYENLFETPSHVLARVIENSQRLAHTLRRTLEPDGIGVYQLNGAAAGQTVFHYHMHLIPREKGDSLRIHTRVRGDDTDLLATSRELATALASGSELPPPAC